MPKITKISPQKNTERLNVYLDQVFAFGINERLVAEFDLTVGKELSQAEISKINKADTLGKCLDKAYRYLSYRLRSEQEVQAKLAEKFSSATVDQAIRKLKKMKYVDDQAFAAFWVETRGGTRGPALLKSELQKKGIARDIIEESLGQYAPENQQERALELVLSKRKYQGLSKEEGYKKVAPYLARRGYNYEAIKYVMNKISPK